MEDKCIFCDIINKKIGSVTVYEDDSFIAILDKFPTAKGHILIIPKKHHKDIFDAPNETLENALIIAKNICIALKKLGYDNINLLQNNGEVAGQSVFHFHLHIIPRKKDDNVTIEFNSQMEEDEVLLKLKDEILKFM